MRPSRFFAILLLYFGCAGTQTVHSRRAKTTTVASTCEEKHADISLGTYNMCLGGDGICPLTNEREEPVLSEFPKEMRDIDIVCVQEVWKYGTIQKIAAALQSSHPYSFFVDTRGQGENAEDHCDADDAAEVIQCARHECSDFLDSKDFTRCAAARCRPPLKALYLLHRPCFRCLVASVGKTLHGIEETCIEGRGASKAYDGANGVAVFSKYPLTNTATIGFVASGAERVALLALVRIPGHWPVEIACTHFSSSESVPPTVGGPFATWDGERGDQLSLVEQALARRAADVGAIQLLVGDMNFGRAQTPLISGYGERNWREALEYGFWSPAALAERPLCSFCARNTISRWTKSVLVDGVLVRSKDNVVEAVCAERRMTKLVQIRSQWENLSDHVAIVVKLNIP